MARYDAFLLDAYGVLVSGSGVLPGAAAFLQRRRAAGKPFLVVSNDASRSPATAQARFERMGLPVDESLILTSGLLLADHFARAELTGAPTIVLGTEDSRNYVRAAGGVGLASDDDTARVVAVADDDGYPLQDTVNDVISVLFRRHGRSQETALVLPNPDLIYPVRPGDFGITAGAIAGLIELVLRLRQTDGARFVPLGKPHAPMFEAWWAISWAPTSWEPTASASIRCWWRPASPAWPIWMPSVPARTRADRRTRWPAWTRTLDLRR